MKNLWRRIVSIVLVLAMVLLGLPEYVSPVKTARADSESTAEIHYLAAGSDRHASTTAIPNAMGAMPKEVEYVCLVGDMAENTESYKTSTIVSEVKEGAGLSNAVVQLLYASPHDNGCNDDAGIMLCKSKSGLMYTGYNTDGSVAYYVYGVAYNSMTSSSSTDADDFMTWVDDACADTSIPIIVFSHVPLHWQRNDNSGAVKWNMALNYAATGEATTADGKEIIRNVVVMYGHNHTTEGSYEYYIPVGANMHIYNESTVSKLYYTYTTAGYLGNHAANENQAASLITISDSTITITKYQKGEIKSTYSDKAYGLYGGFGSSSQGSGDFSDTYLTEAVHEIERVNSVKMTVTGFTVRAEESGEVAPRKIEYSCKANGAEVTPSSVDFTIKSDENGIIDEIAEDGTVSFNEGKTGAAVVTVDWTYNPNAGKKAAKSDGEASGSEDITLRVRGYDEHTWGAPHWDWADDASSAAATFACTDEGCDETCTVTAGADDITSTETVPNCVTPEWTEYTATVTGPDGNTYTGIKHIGSKEDVEVFILVDGFTVDAQNHKKYLIVDSNVGGKTAHALKNDNGTISYSEVLIQNADDELNSVFVLSNENTDSGIVWTATPNTGTGYEQYPTLKNGSHYVNVGGQTDYVLALTTSTSYLRYWVYEGNGRLVARSSYSSSNTPYYVVYEGGFKSSTQAPTTSGTVYIYEKRTVEHSSYGDHEYEFKGITWREGFASAYATFECAHCHTTATVEAQVTTEEREATCLLPKRTAYIATVSESAAPDHQTHTDGDTAYVTAIIGTETTVENATVYVLTNTVVAGRKYLVVSTDSNGSHAISNKADHNSTSVVDTAVVISNGTVKNADGEVIYDSVDYIEPDSANSNFKYAIWTATGSATDGFTFGNDGYYIGHSSNSLHLSNSASSTNNRWKVDTGNSSTRMYYTSSGWNSSTRYLRYNNGWSLSTSSANVLFYEEVSGVTIDTIVYSEAKPNGHEYEYVAAVAPTCESAGTIEHYHCNVCGKDFATNTDPYSKDYLTDLTDPKLEHEWTFVGFAWTETEDGWTAVANYECKNITPSHFDTVTADITVSTTVEATCQTTGKKTFAASVSAENSLDGQSHEAEETKEAVIPMKEHEWEFVGFTWSGNDEDGYTAIATFKCEASGEAHSQNVDADIATATTEATCQAAGSIVYTASITATASLDGEARTATETKTVVIPQKEHEWVFEGFAWTETEDGWTAVAKYKCENVTPAHEKEEPATVTSETTPATFDADGQIVYTATEGGHSEDKTVTIPAIEDVVTFQTTLNMKDYIGINVYIHIPKSEESEASQYTVETITNNTVLKTYGPQNVALTGLPTKNRKISGQSAKFYLIDAMHLASIEMTDTVEVILKKNGEVVKSEIFSVASVAAEKLADDTYDATAKKLLRAILQYGNYAQVQFKHNEDTMPVIYPEAPALVAIPVDYAASGDPTDFGEYIELFEAKLDCKETVSMNIYLTPASGHALSEFEITIMDQDGNAYGRYTKPVMKNGKIYFKIRGINSNKMDKEFQIVVKLKDTDVSATWTRSVITCAYEIYQNAVAENTESAKNVTMAMYQYFLASKEQFKDQ